MTHPFNLTQLNSAQWNKHSYTQNNNGHLLTWSNYIYMEEPRQTINTPSFKQKEHKKDRTILFTLRCQVNSPFHFLFRPLTIFWIFCIAASPRLYFPCFCIIHTIIHLNNGYVWYRYSQAFSTANSQQQKLKFFFPSTFY